MEKVQIICNPNAGRQMIQNNVQELVEFLRDEQKEIRLSYTGKQFDAEKFAFQSSSRGDDIIISIGGDGTVNEVVNGIMKSSRRPRLAIYPAGTVNDFASYLKIPKAIIEFNKMILENNTMKVDVGVSGSRYFLNVAAAGLLPEVAHTVSSDAKTVLGKFAYYIKGIKEFPRLIFKPIQVKFNFDGQTLEKEILFFLLANSPFIGGFKYVAPQAKIDDGYLDLLIVEKKDLKDVATIFLKTFIGSHINHPSLQYLQVKEFTIKSDDVIDLDLDGELAGQLPASFAVKKKAIDMIIPGKK